MRPLTRGIAAANAVLAAKGSIKAMVRPAVQTMHPTKMKRMRSRSPQCERQIAQRTYDHPMPSPATMEPTSAQPASQPNSAGLTTSADDAAMPRHAATSSACRTAF